MSTFAPTPGTRCALTLHLASGVMSNIMMEMVYLRYQRQETVHNKSTTSWREWVTHYNTRAQIHILTSHHHHLHIARLIDRIRREATVATNLRVKGTECTHSDSIRDFAARNQHINWAAENSVAILPRRQTSQTRQTLLQARKAALVLS